MLTGNGVLVPATGAGVQGSTGMGESKCSPKMAAIRAYLSDPDNAAKSVRSVAAHLGAHHNTIRAAREFLGIESPPKAQFCPTCKHVVPMPCVLCAARAVPRWEAKLELLLIETEIEWRQRVFGEEEAA